MSHGLTIYVIFSCIYFILIGGAIYMGHQVVETNKAILEEMKNASKSNKN